MRALHLHCRDLGSSAICNAASLKPPNGDVAGPAWALRCLAAGDGATSAPSLGGMVHH